MREQLIFSAAFGAFSILGVYHLGIYALRRKDMSYFYFGVSMSFLAIFCLDIILSTAQIISSEMQARIINVTTDVLAPLLLAYIHSFFPKDISAHIARSALVLLLGSFLITAFLPFSRAQAWERTVVEPFLVVIMIYALFAIFRAFYMRREGAFLFLMGILPLAISGLAAVLTASLGVISSFILINGAIITILIQSFLLSIRNSKAYADIEQLVKNLSETNLAYSRFVPREFLTLLNKGDVTAVSLGDQAQYEMTILFADVRNFTSISENMTPAENFTLLNQLLGAVGPTIRRHGGFIDKYQGDGIMALFPNSPGDAVRAALEIQNQLSVFNIHRIQESQPVIAIGIGIHTGKLILGTIGESQRMDGTVISDAVNTASRLESLTKRYGASIIASDVAIGLLPSGENHQYRLIGKVRPKGKNNPVQLYEILDSNPQSDAALKHQSQTNFKSALKLYQQGNFLEAQSEFERILTANPKDRAAVYYRASCISFAEHGTPANWDGIEWMTEK